MQLRLDQQRAAEVTDRNVVVSAGAGTGKTAVLVARFVHLVCSRLADVNEILTITFTEKAAEEMKQRIAAEFHRLAMRKERTAVETAYISTIHSFCSRLIKENPFEAGVNPAFEVLDEMDRQRISGELFESLFAQGERDFLELAEHYGDRFVREAIIAYMDLCRSLGRELGYVEELVGNPSVLAEKAQAAADRRAEALLRKVQAEIDAMSTLEATGRYEDKRQEILALRDGLSSVASFRGIAADVEALTSRPPSLPRTAPHQTACQELKERFRRIKALLKDEKAAVFFNREAEDALLRPKTALLKGVLLFWGSYEERKKRDGVLDYEDLQLVARSLLRDVQELRREYRERFRYVLVDEFQDINGLQKELIDLLASGRNLFVVGDMRQSIYGFRNADVEIFADLVDMCQSQSAAYVHIPLGDNFRSGHNLIRFYNSFFSSLWRKERPGFQLLQYARNAAQEAPHPSVEIILAAPDSVVPDHPESETETASAEDDQPATGSQEEGAEELRRKEARAVVARLVALVRGAEAFAWDKDTKQGRPLSYGDIAILCRCRASYPAYTEALDEFSVPYCAVGGQALYDRQEIDDVINLLRAVDNPFRDVPLVAVLRSPFVGVSEETLVCLRRHVENEFDSPYVMEALRRADSISELDDPAKDRLRRFLALFEELRARKDSVSPHELVKEALEATPYQTRLLTSPGGTQKMANVLKFLNILREYSAREAGGIGGFLQFYETMRFYGPREEAAPLEMYSGNTVKLMTIHAAKGLEFPVVVVADMSRSFNFDKGRFLISREMEIACDPWEESAERSCGRAIVFAERKEKQLAEERRLLYVAMTRARDYLILAGACRAEKECDVERARSPLDWLIGVLREEVSPPSSGEACEASFGEARVPMSVNPADVTVPVVESAQSLLERYAPQIEAGEKIPVPEHVTEEHSVTVKEAVERIVLRAASERPLSPPAELSVTQLVLFEVCPHKFLLREVMNFPDRDEMSQLGFGSTGQPFPGGELLDLPSDVFTGARGRRFGDRVHACLEQVDLRAKEAANLSEIVSRLFSLSEEKGAAEKLIRRFLRSEEACRLRNARELYREMPVKAIVENVVIRGIVDVLYRDADGDWTILDFKTGTLPPINSSQWQAYRFQMSLYGFLLSEALSTPPQKAILYFMESGVSECLSLSREATGQTREKIASIVRAIAESDFAKTKGDSCQKCEYAPLCLPECPTTRSSMEGKA